MGEVELTGRLVCRNAEEAGPVARLLPVHIALARAEPGCLGFDVTQTADSLVWQVDERFDREAAPAARRRERVGAGDGP